MKRKISAFVIALLVTIVLSGHGQTVFGAVFPAASPNGETWGNDKVTVDVSNSANGYFMVTYTGSSPKVKLQIKKAGGTTYTYDLNMGNNFEVFPVSEGSGNYTIKVFENVTGTGFSQVFGRSAEVTLVNEFSPFLYPNQYVNFNQNSEVVRKATGLSEGITDELRIVEVVYHYVADNFTYDYEKAETIRSGYIPDPDAVLASGKGICFDYAAVMVSMLRSLDIPSRLVVGYTGGQYHAWVEVWVSKAGMADVSIDSGEKGWVLMDPTFASTGKFSPSVMQYIANPDNYVAMYVY